MSERDALQQLLDSWSTATGIAYTVSAYNSPRAYRAVGEWWKDGNSWCMHLSAQAYATFAAELDDPARRTLTWILQTLANKRQDIGTAFLASLSNLLQAEELVNVASFEHTSDWDPQRLQQYSDGYFVLLDPRTASQPHAVHSEELREVIDAVFPGAYLGSLDVTGQPQLVLLYCNRTNLTDDIESAAMVPEAKWLRRRLNEFADVLEEDAMVACSLFVSRRVQAAADVPDALLTLALMARQRQRLQAPRRLYIWGEQPVQVLLAGLPAKVIGWFLEAVDETHQAPLPQADVRETLFGLMTANLNVSEAARHLYVHRNTLLNRLERIREANGYDLRDFNDALVMWLRYMLADDSAIGHMLREGDVPN